MAVSSIFELRRQDAVHDNQLDDYRWMEVNSEAPRLDRAMVSRQKVNSNS